MESVSPARAGIWGGTAINALEHVAIGQVGFKGLPDEQGNVEIGFGFHPNYGGQGYATEMVQAQVAWALEQSEMYRVITKSLTSNPGSLRVLKKCGFARIGERWDEEEGGFLLLWEKFG